MKRGKLTDIAGLSANLAPRQRILGLDVGSKTIGLALSDPALGLATPLSTIRRAKLAADTRALLGVINEYQVGALVVGLPINMDGSEGPRCQSVRQFVTNIEQAVDLPITLWDERLSTAAVTREMIDADISRRRRSQVVDKLAASYILQGALDRIQHLTRDTEA
jgi:putative Holliday junction resolvase